MELKAQAIDIAYDMRTVVHGMDIRINKKEITTIVGPNGSGKSTVLKAITRLIPHKKGTVYLGGKLLKEYRPKALSRCIGVLPQVHAAPADFRVRELVSYGRMPHQKMLSGLSEEDRRVIDWAMNATGVFEMRDKSIFQISGGERQRVWIATVLAQQPEILFLDEPTTFLDVAHQYETMRLVQRLNRETGIGVVMVLHDLGHALEVSDRIIAMKEGKKYAEGTPSEVITPDVLKAVWGVTGKVVDVGGRPIIVYDELFAPTIS
ncbi:MAG: ABC transporter ATP-binding protein [Oscillospiraceae bacterium]|nr:ABC transporter ATP-binding protein [Oscillospiraceae bacterium]